MRMPLTTLGLVAALLLTAAMPAAGGVDVERPYKGNETGVVNVVIPEGSLVGVVTTESTGNSSHLGRTTSMSSGVIEILFPFVSCLLLDETTQGVVFRTSGEYTTYAANGDTIYGEFENQGCVSFEAPPGVGTAINGTQTILGGTGRFDGAMGSTTTAGVGIGDDFELSWVGTLTY